MNTMRHLEFLRDCMLPAHARHAAAARGAADVVLPAQRRAFPRGPRDALGVQNSRKARLGGLAGLQDPAVMRPQADRGGDFPQGRRRLAAAAACKTAFATIDKSLEAMASIRDDYAMLEAGPGVPIASCSAIARTLVRMAEETAKPNADRLREYRDSNLASLKQELFSTAPIYRRRADRAAGRLAELLYLEEAGRCGGVSDRQLAEKVMAGKSPDQRAAELVHGTKLADVAVRRKLAEAG